MALRRYDCGVCGQREQMSWASQGDSHLTDHTDYSSLERWAMKGRGIWIPVNCMTLCAFIPDTALIKTMAVATMPLRTLRSCLQYLFARVDEIYNPWFKSTIFQICLTNQNKNVCQKLQSGCLPTSQNKSIYVGKKLRSMWYSIYRFIALWTWNISSLAWIHMSTSRTQSQTNKLLAFVLMKQRYRGSSARMRWWTLQIA